MYRKLIIAICVLALLGLTATAVFAGRTRLAKVSFGLGSLIAEGVVAGIGKTDVTMVLDATGDPVVTCTNKGGNQAPGQNPPRLQATDLQSLAGTDSIRKNGRSPFDVEAEVPSLPAVVLGCPNNNWKATIDFVFWTNAVITVKSTKTGEILLQESYTCTTTRNPDGVTCTPN